MSVNRRKFLEVAALGAGAAAIGCAAGESSASPAPAGDAVPAAIQGLKPMTAGIVPISTEERAGRIAKAQRLKLIRRHPHVFGSRRYKTAADVKKNWSWIKARERKQRDEDVRRRR